MTQTTDPNDNNDNDKYTKTKTKTKKECLKDPTYAIFSESRGFKDIKYHILTSQPVNFSLIIPSSPSVPPLPPSVSHFDLADLILILILEF